MNLHFRHHPLRYFRNCFRCINFLDLPHPCRSLGCSRILHQKESKCMYCCIKVKVDKQKRPEHYFRLFTFYIIQIYLVQLWGK